MITKEEWFSLSRQERNLKIQEQVQVIEDIETGRHELSGKPEAGKLPSLRKNAEQFILTVVDWEEGI